MPAKSQAQRGLVFSKRDQYGSKNKTPKKWKWVWDDDWENKGKLPKKLVSESVDNFIDPDDDYMDFNGEDEEEIITTFGPHDTPVGEEPIEFKPSRIKDLERKHKPYKEPFKLKNIFNKH